MKKNRILVIVLASCTLALTLFLTGFGTAPLTAQPDCTSECHEGTWNADRLDCTGNPYNCTACTVVCPEILNKR